MVWLGRGGGEFGEREKKSERRGGERGGGEIMECWGLRGGGKKYIYGLFEMVVVRGEGGRWDRTFARADLSSMITTYHM